MLRQAKEADLPFLNNEEDSDSSSNKSDIDKQNWQEEKKSDSESEQEKPRKYNSERVAVEYQLSSKSSENLGSEGGNDIPDNKSLQFLKDADGEKSSSSDSNDSIDSKDDINHPENRGQQPGLKKKKTIMRRATIFASSTPIMPTKTRFDLKR